MSDTPPPDRNPVENLAACIAEISRDGAVMLTRGDLSWLTQALSHSQQAVPTQIERRA